MKILHVSTTNEWRGGDKQLLTICEILKNSPDLEQFIMAPSYSVLAEECERAGIPFFEAIRTSKLSLPFLRKLVKIIRKEKFEVVHVHDSNAFSLSLLALNFTQKFKLVYSRKRNNPIVDNYLKRLKYNNKNLTKIICVSKAVQDILLPILKEPGKAEIIYDGIDIKKFSICHNTSFLHREYDIGSDELLIGNIAGLTKQKDFVTFLDAANLILKRTNQKIRFIIIGEGPLKKELTSYATSIGIREKVIFAGFRKDIHTILPELDIFLISSETEGLPLTILEAFACKIPVVATAAGGTGEAVKNRETGMISPVKDPEKLAANTLVLVANAQFRKRLSENAFALVNKKFSLDVMRQNYYNFYKSLMG